METENIIKFKPIGIIHSPFKETRGVPIQPSGAKGIKGHIEVFPEFEEGLKDIDGFSHIILIYHFHLAQKTTLKVIPYLDQQAHGIFATRAPLRPNHIGFSVVELLKVEQNILHIQNLDIVDGTPLLDIKPCVPQFDFQDVTKTGWLELSDKSVLTAKDDGRFDE